jgi:peptidoglycan/xylan/chitin deacetylase (PgdA/CDA1 family)
VVFRDVLKRELDEGHQIANHTVNHIDLAHVTTAQIASEIEENELLVNRALLRAGGKPELLTLVSSALRLALVYRYRGHADAARVAAHRWPRS